MATRTPQDISKAILDAASVVEQLSLQLDETVKEMEAQPLQDAATGWWLISEAYDSLDTSRKAIYALEDKLNKMVIPAAFDKAGLDKISVPALKRSFYPVAKYSASILDKDRAYPWLRSNGLSELITETVNAGTLSKALKDLVADTGRDPPEDIFKLTAYSIMGSSKYTPKEK